MPKRVRTPNCTHVDMDRVFGRDQQCYVCGHSPSIGFLYQCRQDCNLDSLQDLLSLDDDKIEHVKSDLRLQLEDVGLSEAIIVAAENGHYTEAQLTRLQEQKLELRQITIDVQQKSEINQAVAKLVAVIKKPSNNDGTFSSSPVKETVSHPTKHPRG